MLRKLRVSKIFTVFDALTFSRDFIDRIDELIDTFNAVSNDNLFSTAIQIGTHGGLFDTLPVWFNKVGLNTIAEWVVSHFETRIQY